MTDCPVSARVKRRGAAIDMAGMVNTIGEMVDAAAFDPGRWSDVARGLRHQVPGTKVVFQALDRTLSRPLPLVAEGWAPQTIDAYLSHFGALNPWLAAWRTVPTLKPVNTEDTLPSSAFRKTPFYTDWLQREGEADSATGLKLLDEDGRAANLSMHYDCRHSERTSPVTQPLLKALAPRMRRALEANRTIARSTAAPLPEAALLHSLQDPAFVVDGDGRMLAANKPALALAAAGSALRIGMRDRVQMADATCQARFIARVRALCTGVGHTPAGAAAGDLVAGEGAERFSLTLLPVKPNLHVLALSGVLPLFLPETVVLAVLRPCVRSAVPALQLLQRRYGLTAAEARVALCLEQGGTLAQIGDRLGISYETVRTHLKAAFGKTGTGNQRELLTLVLKVDMP